LDLQLCELVLSRLLDVGVRFLVAGGWAVRFHGYKERRAKDLDLLVEFSAENWRRLQIALEHFHVPVRPFDKLAQRPKPFRTKHDPVDFLTAIGSAFSKSKSSGALLNSRRRLAVASLLHGVSFDEAWSDSIETSFGEKGLRVRVLSKAHVILSKEHSSRASDIDDVKKLLEAE
jgi:hypothetical protein